LKEQVHIGGATLFIFLYFFTRIDKFAFLFYILPNIIASFYEKNLKILSLCIIVVLLK